MSLGPAELVLILLIIIVLFGATRLPQLGRGLGEGISNFKSGLNKSSDQLKSAAKDDGASDS